MRKLIVILFQFLLLSGSLKCQVKEVSLDMKVEKRFLHEVSLADRKFEHFHYLGASEHYKKALEVRRSPKIQLRLADTYRLLNRPLDAEFWYQQAFKGKVHTTEADWLHYAQMLKANGKYQEALVIFERLSHKGEWITKKANNAPGMPFAAALKN